MQPDVFSAPGLSSGNLKPFFKRIACATVFSILLAINMFAADMPRERLLMDFGWKFYLGNQQSWGAGESPAKAGTSRGPAGTRFNDSEWRTLNLPHDWVVELPFER